MQQYERPEVQLLYFLPRETVASDQAVRETTKDGDETITVGSTPEVSEGVEDW